MTEGNTKPEYDQVAFYQKSLQKKDEKIELLSCDYSQAHPVQILDVILSNFETCKGKFNRLSVEWGKFSQSMNVILRKRTQSLDMDDPEREKLVWVHAYWICKSLLLDLHMKSKLFGQNKIKQLQKESKRLRDAVITGDGPKMDESELIRKLLKKG